MGSNCRDAFAFAVLELARKDPRVCLVLNDCLTSTSSLDFLREYPDRVFDVGIAEQNMVGVAAGLANGGMVPFVCAAACFLTGRAAEQIKVDVALSRTNVKLVGFSSGFAYGSLGPTHHAVDDLAWVRALPNLNIAVPCDPKEAAEVAVEAYRLSGPAFIRLTRGDCPDITQGQPFEFGRARTLRTGSDVTMLSMGSTTAMALHAAEFLSAEGIECAVLNMSSLSPLDVDAILHQSRMTRRLVTIEEHQIEGGLFSAVSSFIVRHDPVPMLAIGVDREFAPVGTTDQIRHHFGLEPRRIAEKVGDWLRRADHQVGSTLCA